MGGRPGGGGEVGLRGTALPVQGPQHGVIEGVEDLPLADEFYLGLGRVDIHIHAVEPGGEMEDAAGELAHHALVLIGLLQSGHEEPGLDEAAIDKEVLVVPGAPTAGGQGDKALHSDSILSRALHREHAQGQLPAQHGVEGRLELAVPWSEELLPAVPEEFEGYSGPGQGLPLDGGEDGGPLGGVLFHELESGGGVVEEIPDHHGGALGTACLLPADHGAPLQSEGNPQIVPAGAGQDLHPGHGGNGGQSLPPEAQGADGRQVVLRAHLAGGMAEEGGLHIGGGDAAAVVGHPDVGHAAVLDLYSDRCGAGVDGIFQQLLYHRGGALHHLAGGNEVGHMAVQNLDVGHGVTCFPWGDEGIRGGTGPGQGR